MKAEPEKITDVDLWAHIQKLAVHLGRQPNAEDIWEDAKAHKSSPWNTVIPWDVELDVAVRTYQLVAIRQKYSAIQVRVVRREISIGSVGYESDPLVMRDPDAASREPGYVSVVELMDDPGRAGRSVAYDVQRALALVERTERRAGISGTVSEYEAARTALEVFLLAATAAGQQEAVAA